MWPAIIVTFCVALVAGSIAPAWLDWRRRAPMRREVRAQDVTCRIELGWVRVKEAPYDWRGWRSRTRMYLSIRGDAIEISASSPPERLEGAEYYCRPARRRSS